VEETKPKRKNNNWKVECFRSMAHNFKTRNTKTEIITFITIPVPDKTLFTMPTTILTTGNHSAEETTPMEVTYVERYSMGTELKSIISSSLGGGDFEIHYACGGGSKPQRHNSQSSNCSSN
jgi:hypothetical protein